MEAAGMKTRMVRDLIGDPSSWQNLHDGDDNKMPDMDGATILDIFCTGNQLAIYARNAAGIESLSKFYVADAALCARIAEALKPGLNINEALTRPIH
jgi:hypothetical protein